MGNWVCELDRLVGSTSRMCGFQLTTGLGKKVRDSRSLCRAWITAVIQSLLEQPVLSVPVWKRVLSIPKKEELSGERSPSFSSCNKRLPEWCNLMRWHGCYTCGQAG